MGGCSDGHVDHGRTDGRRGGRTDRRVDGPVNGRGEWDGSDGHIGDGRTGGRKSKWTADGWTEGRADYRSGHGIGDSCSDGIPRQQPLRKQIPQKQAPLKQIPRRQIPRERMTVV